MTEKDMINWENVYFSTLFKSVAKLSLLTVISTKKNYDRSHHCDAIIEIYHSKKSTVTYNDSEQK